MARGLLGSSAARWPPIARFIRFEAALGEAALRRGPFARGAYEFLRFGIKQGWACLFGGVMLAALILSHLLYPAATPLARYDALFLFAVAVQAAMLAGGLERWDEAVVIAAFHLIGTVMEVHKTAIGAWIYPEAGTLRIGHVPLFTGFMYAAVGSYLARVWRLFDFRFTRHPRLPALALLAAAIYVNFLTDHTGIDLRWGLLGVTALLFARTTIHFQVWRGHRSMPLLLGFLLVALFIWFAENIGTVTGTWLYPRQLGHWTMVPLSKLTSWFLLMIVSYTLVAFVAGITDLPAARCAADLEPRLE